jgi:hypothetical protein
MKKWITKWITLCVYFAATVWAGYCLHWDGFHWDGFLFGFQCGIFAMLFFIIVEPFDRLRAVFNPPKKAKADPPSQ